MAIKFKLNREDSELKYPFPEAYAKVLNVKIDLRLNEQIVIDVAIYADEESRNAEKSFSVDKRSYKTSISEFKKTLNKAIDFSDESSIKTLAYEYLIKKKFIQGENV
jgi:hypothetical protein